MAKRKIMVIDDDVALSQVLKRSLELAGRYEVLIENKPKQARKAAEEFRPDLVVLDVIMPDMDGGTVAAEIRQDDRLKGIPVIFLTSILGKEEAADRGGKIGHDPVLAKPVTANELMDLIEKCLSRTPGP